MRFKEKLHRNQILFENLLNQIAKLLICVIGISDPNQTDSLTLSVTVIVSYEKKKLDKIDEVVFVILLSRCKYMR